MAGLGLDAKMLDGASKTVKKRFGWAAYVVSALSRMTGLLDVVVLTAQGWAGATRSSSLRTRCSGLRSGSTPHTLPARAADMHRFGS